MKSIRTNTIFFFAVIAITANAKVPGRDVKNVEPHDSSRVYDIDEVVVVSQPKETFRLRQQPASSTSFSDVDIQRLGIRDLRDVSAYTPSFVMPNYGSRLTSSMYIRGIGSRINSPAVGIYIDGMPIINKSAFNFHTYFIERIDVMRGPQGTLYGQNTEGGLVRMYTKDPMKRQGTDMRISLGTRLLRNVEMMHNTKFTDDLALSMAAFYNGQNGFLRNEWTGDRADNINEAGGKLRLAYRPTSDMSVDLITDYQYVRQNGFAYGLADRNTGAVSSPSTNYQSNYRRNVLNSGLIVRTNSDLFDFSSTTTYQYLKDYMLMDQDYTPVDYMHLVQRQFQNALTQEFTFKNNNHDNIWQWTFGAFGSYQWLRTDAPVFFGEGITKPIGTSIQTAMYNGIVTAMARRMMDSGMPEAVAMAAAKSMVDKAGGVGMDVGMDVPGTFRTPFLNAAVFHESNVRLNDRLTATVGLRYDFSRAEIEYDTKAVMAMNASVMGKSDTYTLTSKLHHKEHSVFNQLLPKIGLTYKLSDKTSNLYAAVSKGYRAGGYNIQMFSDILQTQLNANSSNAMRGDYEIENTDEDYANIDKTIAYKPETSWNYEVGAHLNLFKNSMHVDLAAYCMNISNQQLSVMAGNYGFGRMMVNAGRSRSLGFEAALRGQAFSARLSWGLSYGFTHAVFRDYKDQINTESGKTDVNYKGKHVPYVPGNTLSSNVSYRIDTDNTLLHSLTFGMNMKALGRTYWDESNTYCQPFYATVDMNISADMGKVGVNLWCRNITNTKYNTFAINSSATGVENTFAQRGFPVQAGVDINIHF